MHIPKLQRSTDKEKKFLDKFSYPVSVIFPLLTIPQIIEIFTRQSVEGLSVFTWVFYAVMTFIILLWAIADNIKQMIISQSLWLLMYAAVIVGIAIYS